MVALNGGKAARLERALDEARSYRDSMWAEAENTRAWGGQSHLDRLMAYGQSVETCRRLSDALGDALLAESLAG